MLSPLYSESVIAERVREIADRLNAQYAKADLVHAIVTLNGAFIFAADLVRQLKFPLMLHFAGATSYMGTEQQKDLRINADAIPHSFGNKPVILIEDIIDSGKTISKLRQIMADRFASSITVVALLRRQGGGGNADYFGFTVPPGLFVVGYGLDLDGRYRELRDIQGFVPATMSREKSKMC
jgi:hypoxanthine phosphoribosyltransferase